FGLVFLYSCGYNLFLLAPSIYLLQIYDRVLSSRSADTLLMLTMIIAIGVMVGSTLDIVRRAALSRIGASGIFERCCQHHGTQHVVQPTADARKS
ncbi:hypothetical protein ACC791_36785, partial [Rhizobium ruizarguesonis]